MLKTSLSLCAAGLLALTSITATHADDKDVAKKDSDKKETKKVERATIVIRGSDGKTKTLNLSDLKGAAKDVDVQVQSRAVIVGSDGKAKTIDLSGKDAKARALFLLKDGKKNLVELPGKGAKVEGRAIFVGPDGKAKTVEVDEIKLGEDIDFEIKNDGNNKIRGRVRIVGSDGKVQEFDLPAQGDAKHLRFGFSGDKKGEAAKFFHLERLAAPGKYMLGLAFEPVGEALRSHLKVAEGALMVSSTTKGSPAEKAGFKKYDIVVGINDSKQANHESISKAVQDAGKAGKAVSVRVLRAGKPHTIKVKPTERKGAISWTPSKKGHYDHFGLEFDEKIHKSIEEALKGSGVGGDLRKHVEEALKAAHGAKDAKGSSEPIRRSIRMMRVRDDDSKKEIEDIKKQIEALQKAVKELSKSKKK